MDAHEILALTCINIGAGSIRALSIEDLDDNEAYTRWKEVYDDCQFILTHPEVTEDFKKSALDGLYPAVFGMSKACYELEEYTLAIDILEDFQQEYTLADNMKIILGLLYLKTAITDTDNRSESELGTLFLSAYRLLSILEENPELEVDSKYKFFAFLNLANIYRNPISGVQYNLEAAYRCVWLMTQIADAPQEAHSFAEKELRKYSKNIFGKLTYKG